MGSILDRIRSKFFLVVCGVVVSIIIISIIIAFSVVVRSEKIAKIDDSLDGTFQKAAIVANAAPCASIGKEILRKGGNAVDAIIAAMFCDGVAIPRSMGLGGGFFMIIYNKTLNNFTAIDARETAPAAAVEDMFNDNVTSYVAGGLSVAIPSELKGYWVAYQKFGGGVPWKELVLPTIKLCEEGIPISEPLAKSIIAYPELMKYDPEFRELYFNSKTGKFLQAGDSYKNLKLAHTLRIIANEGGDALYHGELAASLVLDIQSAGGIITEEDLSEYQVRIEEPFVARLDDTNFTMYSLQAPSSGPVLAYILRLMSGLLPAPSELLTTQRFTEALKYAYAARGELGDHNFVNVTSLMDRILSSEFIDQVRRRIDDFQTWNDTEHYYANFTGPDDNGTANLAVLSENGDAVVATSTINLVFGSKFISPSTGILLNNEMNDFSTPDSANFFKLPPSENNYIKPGKRPMSSMCPTIITDNNGNVKLLIGGAGGSTITSAVAIAAARSLLLNEDIRTALDHILFHHQLVPMTWQYYMNTPQDIIEGMRNIGHGVALSPTTAFSAINAIQINGDEIHASCDRRRPGQVAGY